MHLIDILREDARQASMYLEVITLLVESLTLYICHYLSVNVTLILVHFQSLPLTH
ncbi:hypothetical protein SDC9_209365 [bioreactor metagenome]|uniref:Uncharacterized protein n=1 Tax=bioreactor metagenome TaxID=1076179 RepID=A0A645JE67_9ZZZZ